MRYAKSSRTGTTLARLTFLSIALAAGGAAADEDDARNLLRAMSDYMAQQQKISFKFDSDLEVVTDDLQKVTFASSGTVSLSRPDKIRITRTGGFADVEMIFDGQRLTILGKNLNRYAEVEAPGTIDALVDHLRADLGLEIPGADLLRSDVYAELMDAVVEVKDFGSGVIAGVECNHLAFRTKTVDWEIWIAMGDQPYPCRYVIASKLMSQSPEYRVQVSDWTTGDAVAADDFGFANPGGATKVEAMELRGLDELPDLTAGGTNQ